MSGLPTIQPERQTRVNATITLHRSGPRLTQFQRPNAVGYLTPGPESYSGQLLLQSRPPVQYNRDGSDVRRRFFRLNIHQEAAVGGDRKRTPEAVRLEQRDGDARLKTGRGGR